jgi:iron complex outermembrane receptor protein
VGGLRLSGTYLLGSGPTAPRLVGGADAQRLRDNRKNFVSSAGARTDQIFVDQQERVTELGPFAQVQWSPRAELLLSGGARFDWIRFAVTDHYFGDGIDDSGARTMSSLSGNVGASWSVGDQFVPYVNLSTSFETPTTTELANRPTGAGGFNPELGPQRAVNYEVGARGQAARAVSYSVALFLGRISDAIVQVGEIGGRAFFGNTGKTHNDGAEVGLTVTPVSGVSLSGAYTYAHYRFASGPNDGKRLPGVPEHFWRLGLRTALPHDLYVDVDHTLSSSLAADDANSLIVDSWGAGVTNARLGWQGTVGSLQVGPFLGVNNLWDRQYVGSVTLNGIGGRVFEPAPRRVIYLGAELGYRAAAPE